MPAVATALGTMYDGLPNRPDMNDGAQKAEMAVNSEIHGEMLVMPDQVAPLGCFEPLAERTLRENC